jgi:chorismate mutase
MVPRSGDGQGEGGVPRAPGDEGAGSGSGPELEARLDRLRVQITALDEELIRLVGKRRDLAIAIGETKAALGLPTMDPGREARVVRRAAEVARTLGVDEEMARDVIWRVMAAARQAQDDTVRNPSPLDGPAD